MREQTVFRFFQFDDVLRVFGLIFGADVDLPVVERHAHVRSAEDRGTVADNDRRVRANVENRAVNHLDLRPPVVLCLDRISGGNKGRARHDNCFARRGADDPHVAFVGQNSAASFGIS